MSHLDKRTEQEAEEALYAAYKRDRDGSRITDPMTHDQIHLDGVYGDFIDDFGDRYWAEQKAYEQERAEYQEYIGYPRQNEEPRF